MLVVVVVLRGRPLSPKGEVDDGGLTGRVVVKGHERFRFCGGCCVAVVLAVVVDFGCQSPEGRVSGSGDVSGVSILMWAILLPVSLLLLLPSTVQ